MKHKIIMSLPPSVNKRMIRMNGSNRFILSKEARNYLMEAGYGIREWCDKNKVAPIKHLFYLDMKFYLPNNRSDSHNFKKILFDALETGGLVANDKVIMDRTQSVEIDESNPRVELIFEISCPR